MALKERISKEAILEAAEVVFSEKGFHEAKVYKIAEIANVSVGSIYRFFDSKEELYAGVLKRKLEKLERKVKKAIRGKKPEEALRAYIKTAIEFFDEEEKFFSLFVKEVSTVAEADREKFDISDWYEKYVNSLSKVVKRGIKRGEFKEVDPKATILTISGAIRNLICAKLRGTVKLSSEEIRDNITEIVLKGIKKGGN